MFFFHYMSCEVGINNKTELKYSPFPIYDLGFYFAKKYIHSKTIFKDFKISKQRDYPRNVFKGVGKIVLVYFRNIERFET